MISRRQAERTGLVSIEARELLHGCVGFTTEPGGWVRPLRFSGEQIRAVGSCQAWHPGLLRQMARTTSGVTIEFETDASEISLEVTVDPEPTGTAAVLERIDGDEHAFHDGISADIDGRHLAPRMPEGEVGIDLTLDDVSEPDAHGMLRLPGFGVEHHVRIWLPALRGCVVRTLVANGTYVRPVPERRQLLVIGDSIAQGFVVEDPAHSWPALLADRLGLDLVNQGLGGQVFQPGTLFGLAHLVDAAMVVVALGENYRFEPCLARPVARDVRNYLVDIARIWGSVPTYVLTPLFHDESLSPSHPMSCWRRVPSMIAANVAVHDEMTLVEGERLMDARTALLADADGHPNPDGARQVATRLHAAMLYGRGSADERRERALELLESAPLNCLPLLEAARHDMGEFLVAEEGCMLWDAGDGELTLYAPDLELGRAIVASCVGATSVCVLGEDADFLRYVQLSCGLRVREPFHLAFYEGGEPLTQDGKREVRKLDEGYFEDIAARWEREDPEVPVFVETALAQGRFLGGFEGEELVGYVGERPDGSLGMLEVLEGHRRKGWARTLIAAKANQLLAQGRVPWCAVYPQYRYTLEAVRSLGFAVMPATEQCYLRES